MEDLTFERANEVLSYDSETGTIRWKVAKARRIRAGDVAGCEWRYGRTSYRRIRVEGGTYLAHRIAWLLEKGEWPSGHIDHLDGDGLNNRIANLRDVTNAENHKNTRMRIDNKSGVSGVSWHKNAKKWQCFISAAGRRIYLGLFDSLADAATARHDAENKYGFTERHGKNDKE